MFTVLIIVTIAIGALFVLGVPFGAPFLPTLNKRVEDGLDLLDLKEGQTMLELGCGDGRLLKAAAHRGIKSVGYELNPVLVIYAKIICWRQRDLITIHWGNYWEKEWPPSDGMYVFLLQPFMSRLHTKVVQYANKKPYKVVSFAYTMTEKTPTKELNGMMLYEFNT